MQRTLGTPLRLFHRQVNGVGNGLAEVPILCIADHADNFHVGHLAESDVFADRILAREVLARDGLIDDRDSGPACMVAR